MYPASWSRSTAPLASSGAAPRCSRYAVRFAAERSRCASAFAATSRAVGRPAIPKLGPRGRLFLDYDRRRLAGLELRQQPCRNDLALGGLHLHLLQDPLHDVGVLLEERRRVLTALAETRVAEAEVRARLRD